MVSVATYSLFNMALHMNELIANIYSWIITVLFAFFYQSDLGVSVTNGRGESFLTADDVILRRQSYYPAYRRGDFVRIYNPVVIFQFGGKNSGSDCCDHTELCNQ